jgi:hypothetical protein
MAINALQNNTTLKGHIAVRVAADIAPMVLTKKQTHNNR